MLRYLFAAVTTVLAAQSPLNAAPPTAEPVAVARSPSYLTTPDGVELYYKDWGPRQGEVVVFSHGWPLNSDSWEVQMQFLAARGYRVVAHDRRGHGRSSQPWSGNDMDHYADDLAVVLNTLDLDKATLVGFSTGGGEVARYIGRHGTARVRRAVLVSAVPPRMLMSDDNPKGVPGEVFDLMRAAHQANRGELYRDIASGPFYGFKRQGAKSSQTMIDTWVAQGMQAGAINTYDCIAAFSATDFRADLAKFDIPTLVIHGDDDQIVPIDISAEASAAMIRNATLRVYHGAPHGLTQTHADRLNQDLLHFLRQ
ncbi:alpha/beta fold hydrolase [Stenotrophomonas cyclobalanopsidis]|nr:alpha/beta hydrolase [Stenotrophomonas cyclobalanopsidis]